MKQFLLATIESMNDRHFIDHHIQTTIVESLHKNGEQPFSSLKPSGVENSLFMYHIRKLVSRGIVEKTDTGFRLSASGASWANQTDYRYRAHRTPRFLIQFLVIQDDTILISERTAHMAEHLNRYMLPGGLHTYGSDSQHAAIAIAECFNLTLTSDRVASAEIILPDTDYHAFVDYYTASALAGPYHYDDGIFSMNFMPLTTALTLGQQEANFISDIIALYQHDKLSDRHVFIA